MSDSGNSLSWRSLLDEIRSQCREDVIADDMIKLLNSYTSNEENWRDYAVFDPHKYTRNLVDTGNDRYNLILICWGEGQGSCIHDHSGSQCVMKIMSGKLRETLFQMPKREGQSEMTVKEYRDYAKDEVAHINDDIGLHRVENPSHADTAVSLHLYFPPIKVCRSFNQQTGESRQCQPTFYSQFGQQKSQ
ncbi:PREDICTED: cysteine dioxygenase 1-like [Amphimedon queenslandica]|uniref:Cysteine dioxygenase n=1 Tax=Amphimedon queenslandica TaxID=400682 RepID=A0A1X7VVU1_AMPQE|nr:PREDICTED: cysteine dioxygenase 1-like [Amphimedon queenslandica]|eukprot:XP_003382794.1 PREDICTED: cysteine dioxygenase 1-like [Amphimedon queenslandica]